MPGCRPNPHNIDACSKRVHLFRRRIECRPWEPTLARGYECWGCPTTTVCAAVTDGVERVYLHIDLDALDPSEGRANEYSAPGGPTLEQLVAALDAVFSRFANPAAAVTAYDPACDASGRMAESATLVVETVAERVLARH
jgi:hypothetical protein